MDNDLSMGLPPEKILQAFFLLSALLVLVVNSIPMFRDRFLVYGSRSSNSRSTTRISSSSRLDAFFDFLASFQVPHSWFLHFYVISLLSSSLWAAQLLSDGRLWKSVSTLGEKNSHRSTGMSLNNIILTWALMSLQGCRRLYESAMIGKPSSAKMWIVHWLLGLGFYAAMGIAVWVEGIPILRQTIPTFDALSITLPSVGTTMCTILFATASTVQHTCHAYLASLKKYSLPNHPYFRYLLCPHYTAECTIYLALSLLAAPEDRTFNATIFTAFLFVLVNLGVTAETSRVWYESKFGANCVEGRWRMIPFVY